RIPTTTSSSTTDTSPTSTSMARSIRPWTSSRQGSARVASRTGEAWSEAAPLPGAGVVVHSDAEARAVVTRARRAGVDPPVIGLAGGDLCRTLGGTGDVERMRSDDARTFVCDLGSVLVDGRIHWFVAHLIARRWWWRGR